jgi:hypothetical protein
MGTWSWFATGLGCLAVVSAVTWRLYAGFFHLKRETAEPRPGFYLILGGQELASPHGYCVISTHSRRELKFPEYKVDRIWIENFDADAADPATKRN